MHFVLWYNILSLHQSAFVKALAEKYDVTVIAERTLDSDCLHEQQNVPDMGNAKIITEPDQKTVSDYIADKQAYHLVCGIDFAFKTQKLVARLIKKSCKVLCYCEPYVWNDKKGFLRRLKYFFLYLKYGRKLTGVLTMGNTGRTCYRMAGFPDEKLYDWGYFTESHNKEEVEESSSQTVKFVFVGRLDENKNCLLLLDTLSKIQANFSMTVVGDGICRSKMEHFWKNDSRFSYSGLLPNTEVHKVIRQHDVLILPSNYDGWGAVVNEALQNGTRVVCSENCGSAVLIGSEQCGQVFKFRGSPDLRAVLLEQIQRGKQTPANRKELQIWSENHISGRIVAEYFVEICNYLSVKNKKHPVAPWLV